MRGRTKHAVKKEAWAGKLLIEKRQLAQYGDRYNGKAASLITLIREALLLEEGFDSLADQGIYWPGVSNADQHQKARDSRHRLAWKHLSMAFTDATVRGDGGFFRSMADLIEGDAQRAKDPQVVIGQLLQAQFQLKQPKLTIPQILEYLSSKGINTSYNQVKRILKYYEAAPAPGAPGRPKTPAPDL